MESLSPGQCSAERKLFPAHELLRDLPATLLVLNPGGVCVGGGCSVCSPSAPQGRSGTFHPLRGSGAVPYLLLLALGWGWKWMGALLSGGKIIGAVGSQEHSFVGIGEMPLVCLGHSRCLIKTC